MSSSIPNSVVPNQSTQSIPSSAISEASRLTAISRYLSSLKNLHLVSPSIGLPYPRDKTEEKMIIHRSLLTVQTMRLRNIDTSISRLKEEHNLSQDDIINSQEFKDLSQKLQNKVQFLKKKFLPQRIPTHRTNKTKEKNAANRERHKLRKIRKYFDRGKESVINLSSTPLTPSQMGNTIRF